MLDRFSNAIVNLNYGKNQNIEFNLQGRLQFMHTK